MNRQQEQQQKPALREDVQQAQAPPPTAVATNHLEVLATDLDQIKKKDQLFTLAIAGMAKNPVLSGGEKHAVDLIQNIKQCSGE